jgi:3'-phosphoadenosine 5'-phosphosulfate sulfotransferase (PAPS reductase)/FAD synthetase
MFEKRIIARQGPMKGRVHQIGKGWPHPKRRWCTGRKLETLTPYINAVNNAVCCVGIAADEKHRTNTSKRYKLRYPLIEYNKTEADCMEYCKRLGYHWGGLYDLFKRVSCYCCPLQSLDDLRTLRKHYPDLWERMLDMDLRQPRHNQGFKGDKTLIDLECRFTLEDMQREVFDNGENSNLE